MCLALDPQVSLVVFSRVCCVVRVVHTDDTVSIAMAGKDGGCHLVHIVRPLVWGADLLLLELPHSRSCPCRRERRRVPLCSIRPYTPRQHDVPSTGAGPQVD